ncbi:hypothetical protein CSW59_15340 [Caulobacter sp. BP25]|nr:hypothetical protein CSW59_15340 [Caulobacter sp. BP25]
MLVLETVAKIRREHFARGKGVKTIAREMGLARNTMREPAAFAIEAVRACWWTSIPAPTQPSACLKKPSILSKGMMSTRS